MGRHDCDKCCCETPPRNRLKEWVPPREVVFPMNFEEAIDEFGDEDEYLEELSFNSKFGTALIIDGEDPPPPVDPPVVGLTSARTLASPVANLGRFCVNAQTTATTAAGYRHDPDGIYWITSPWPVWDNIPIPGGLCTKTKAEIKNFVWPSGGWQMRGLRDEFYSDPPFVDNLSPTVMEIENWNVRVIALYRRLLGVSLPIANSTELYQRADFNDQRKFSTVWDVNYPGVPGSANGPCTSGGNAHCGATFLPSCADQALILPPGSPCLINTAGAEGVFGGEMDWPWAIKLSRILFKIVEAEGITGHGGPFVNRPYVGMSFYCHPGTANFTVRIKWNGPLVNACP